MFLITINKIQAKKTKIKRITHVHGSLSALDLMEREEKEKRREEAKEKKEMMKQAFLRCKGGCECKKKPCKAKGLKRCPNCFNVLRSVCSKKECMVDGDKPSMLLLTQGTPKAGPSSTTRSRVLQFSDTEDTDTDMESVSSYIDSESENDEVNSNLEKVWKSVSLPVPEEELIGRWYAVIVNSKKRKTLYIAKVVRRFLLEANGPVDCLEMCFLMPKYGSGDIIDDTPEHLPDDLGMVYLIIDIFNS